MLWYIKFTGISWFTLGSEKITFHVQFVENLEYLILCFDLTRNGGALFYVFTKWHYFSNVFVKEKTLCPSECIQ